VGATPEILGGLDRRLLAEGTDAEALAAAICRFLDGAAPSDGWAAPLTPDALHGFVTGRYSWDRHADAVEEVYRDALARRNGRPEGGR
jgi:glycosyltransferase involved in cell wall biosynthesis